MARNSLFFNKRSNSFLKTWLGERKARKPSQKVTNSLFRRKAKKISKK
jgi:phosphoribosyl-ATP pyrophosphohydrolase